MVCLGPNSWQTNIIKICVSDGFHSWYVKIADIHPISQMVHITSFKSTEQNPNLYFQKEDPLLYIRRLTTIQRKKAQTNWCEVWNG